MSFTLLDWHPAFTYVCNCYLFEIIGRDSETQLQADANLGFIMVNG